MKNKKTKKMITIRFVLLSLTLSIFCCNTYGQNTKMVLYYKDGKMVSGYGKLVGENKIKFKTSKKAKSRKMGYEDLKEVKSIKYYYGDELEDYEFVKIKDDKIKLLERTAKGKINLFRRVRIISGSYMPNATGGINTGGMWIGNNVMKNYYVQRQGENSATHLGSNQLFTKSFKKAMSEYVKDCPSLVEKNELKELKKRDLIEIVEYYNEHCKD